MDETDRVAVLREPPLHFVAAADRLAVARQHELGLEREHRVERFDVVERPARGRAAQRVEVRKRPVVVVTDEGRLELGNPHRQMIGCLTGGVQQLEADVAKREPVALVERPRRHRRRGLCDPRRTPAGNGAAKLRGVAPAVETREPQLIRDEVRIGFVRDDRRVGAAPQVDAAGVIGVRVREDDRLDRRAAPGAQRLFVRRRCCREARVDHDVAGGCGDQERVARRRRDVALAARADREADSLVDAVAEIEHACLLSAQRRDGHGAGDSDGDEKARHKAVPRNRACR